MNIVFRSHRLFEWNVFLSNKKTNKADFFNNIEKIVIIR